MPLPSPAPEPRPRAAMRVDLVILGALLASPIAAQSHLYTFTGPAGGGFGRAVSGAGDVNADGFADLIIGAPSAGVGIVQVLSGRDGSILHAFSGSAAGAFFGHSVSGAGDVNADGFDDVIVGDPRDSTAGYAAGTVRVFSGMDGSVLHTFHGPPATGGVPGSNFGHSVSGAGDVNQDGYDDVIIGAPFDPDPYSAYGAAFVMSGRDGSRLVPIIGGIDCEDFLGWSVSAAGDVNGNGFPDVIVGAPQPWNSPNPGRTGYALVIEGGGSSRGNCIHTFKGVSRYDGFGTSVSGASDVDGDGVPDLIAGAPEDDNNGTSSGSATTFSGRTGGVLRSFDGDSAGDRFGISVSIAGDVNADGYADVIVGAHHDDNTGPASGSARVLSGLDGSILYTLNGAAGDRFGYSVSGAGDVDGAGYLDLIVGRYEIPGTPPGDGRVFSGRMLPLTTDVHFLSLSGGGTQVFTIDAGVAHAGRLYLLGGSLSGISPGFGLGAATLPLNPDPYLQFTFTRPNTLISGSLGFLDVQGQATASFTLPVGLDPGLAGTLLDHAYAVVAFGGPVFPLASNPVPLLLAR